MKNKLFIILSVLTSVFFTACQTENNIDSIAGPTLDKVTVGATTLDYQKLIAGQTIDAGIVKYEDIDTDGIPGDDALKITYQTSNGWELTEVHFFIGSSLSQMPATKSGNPQIGLFPYKSGNITGNSYSIVIPFTTFGFACNNVGDNIKLVVAAHASVRKDLGNGSYQTETGWGDGARLVQRGNWSMFNTITISCDPTAPIVTEDATETAFAFDGDQSSCFQNYSEYLDNPKRWGWSNGPLSASPNAYTMDIYAGAGLCDITKGTKVGTLTVNYNGSTAVVKYALSGTNPTTGKPYYMTEAHLYVGNGLFATNKRGEFTLAPGQYPYIAENLGNNVTTKEFTITGLSGDVYVVAHAVVGGFPKN